MSILKNLTSRFLMALALLLLLSITLPSPSQAGPGDEGQEPWPLFVDQLTLFQKSDIVGFWKVNGTSWILHAKGVRNNTNILMVQLWDVSNNQSIFNGPLRIQPRWIEGVAVMKSSQFCSIYIFKNKENFVLRLQCEGSNFDYNMKKVERRRD